MTYSNMNSNDHANAVLFYNWLLLYKKRCQVYVSSLVRWNIYVSRKNLSDYL